MGSSGFIGSGGKQTKLERRQCHFTEYRTGCFRQLRLAETDFQINVIHVEKAINLRPPDPKGHQAPGTDERHSRNPAVEGSDPGANQDQNPDSSVKYRPGLQAEEKKKCSVMRA
jgi:hypothetical protein